MYKCRLCGGIAPANVPAKRKVITTRVRQYPHRSKVHRYVRPDDGRVVWNDDPGGTGTEIVKELLVCGPCAVMPALSGQS